MAASGVIVGGSYEFHVWGDHESPVFSFHAPDLEQAAALLRDMVVELDVRLDRLGRLGYQLAVPDRQAEPAVVPVQAGDLARVEQGALALRACPARVVDGRGGVLPLDRFYIDLAHDWSGVYARAVHDFQGGRPEQAAAVLAPLADVDTPVPAIHHLLGRCQRARGDVGAAIPHLLAGVRHAAASHGDRLLPAAAAILTDLGTSFKKLGMTGKAAHCLLHALQLRPNHPEALLVLASVFPPGDALQIYALGRVLAIGREDLAREAADALAQATSRSALDILRQAEEAAPRIDLATWPLARPDLGHTRSFLAGLERLGMTAPADPTSEDELLVTSESGTARVSRPWWKFW